MMYVRGKEIKFDNGEPGEVWLELSEDGVRVLEDFEPDPFSRVANIRKGYEYKIGIYRYKVVGDVAYTR